MSTIATSKNLTWVGVAMIVGAIATAAIALLDGDAATNPSWELTIGAIMTGIGFIMGKGAASTGGTVPETQEAVKRVDAAPRAT